jgi:YD repeat-containing protein
MLSDLSYRTPALLSSIILLFNIFARLTLISVSLTDWQFLSATFTTQPGRIVESITVSCVYAYQPGVAYFDNISLVEEIGNNTARYAYTEDGLLEFMYTPSYCQYNMYDSNTRVLLETWDSDGNGTANEYTNRVLKSQTTFRYDAESNDLLSWYLFTRFESETSTWNPATTAISKTEYSINAFGLNTGTVSYAATGTKDDATQDSNSLQLRSYTTYNLTTGSALFGRVLSAADTSGYTTSYTYGPNGQLLYEKYHDGSGLYYMYDALGRMTNVYPLAYSPSVNAYYADTAGEKAVYTYNSNRQMESVTTASTVYTFTYDDFGNVTAVYADGNLLATYTYGSNNGKLTTLTYGSGKTMHYSYDALDRVSEICYNDNESVQHKYICTYTASGAVHSLECTESGRKYQYSYNSRGQLIGYTELAVRENAYTDLSQSFFWYDDLNRLDYAQTTFRYAVGDTNYLSEADYYDAVGYGYTYDNSASGRDGSGVGALTELEIFGGGLHHGATISYGYDGMYRLTEKTTTANENAGFSQTVSYGYRQLGSGRTTGQVSSYRSGGERHRDRIHVYLRLQRQYHTDHRPERQGDAVYLR